MSNTSSNYPEVLLEEIHSMDGDVGVAMVDGDVEVATVDAEAEPVTTAECTGPCCEKCQAPLDSEMMTICRKCGWYPSLGTFVEIDANLETAMNEEAPAPKTQPKSHLRVWIDLVPAWGWVIIDSVFAVIVESIVARLATPAGGSLRTMWSLGQLALGIITAAGCHAFNFLLLAAEDADVGLLDLLLKPIKLWAKTCHNLPRKLKLVNSAVCGLVAAVMAPLVIGGIPYERFWDWGFQQPVKQELMGAIMDRAKKLDSRNGSDNLEDAIGDFAGKAGVDGDDPAKHEPPKPRQKADCVILGYQLDREGQLETLYLGTAFRTRLVFAGKVKPKLTGEERSQLLGALKSIMIKEPFVAIQAENVVWVKAKFTCRVSFTEQFKDGRFRDAQWESLLGSVK